jgi:signal transduction histidine kinase/CheY-like chemotaxis protein
MKQTLKKFVSVFKSGRKVGDAALSGQFESHRLKVLEQAVKIGALLATVLVPTFGLLDFILKRDVFWIFIYIRLSVMFIAIGVILLSETGIGKRNPYYLGAFLTLIVSGSIALMCRLDQGPIDPYYAGINLPLLGFGILLPLTWIESIPIFILAWLSYFIPNIVILRDADVPLFISNNFFMVTTLLVAVTASQFHLRYLKKQWLIHYHLERAHAKIRNHSEELEKTVQERTQKLLQTERLAVVGQLAGGIAHDFNNHLTAILGVSELLLRTSSLRKGVRQDIQSIQSAGKRASDLVKQLLTFSRKQMINAENLSLNDVIHAVRKLLQRLIGEDIDLLIHPTSDLKQVRLDPGQVEQIIMNLAVNARDAMPRGGKLLIETSNILLDEAYCDSKQLSLLPGEYVLLAVTDNGKGMTEEVRHKIFEPFFTTKEKGCGTGLGLASVYGIVKQAKGDILVYSEPGIGTTFKIFLPAVQEYQERKRKAPVAPKKLPRGSETILLVEDEDSVRDFTAKLLSRQGYRVVEAREGREAIEKVQSLNSPIDLLMTDVVMPHMDGHDLASRLSKMYDGIKVLYMSGYSNTFIASRGMIQQGKAFLQKPFTVESLSVKVRDIIDN